MYFIAVWGAEHVPSVGKSTTTIQKLNQQQYKLFCNNYGKRWSNCEGLFSTI